MKRKRVTHYETKEESCIVDVVPALNRPPVCSIWDPEDAKLMS
jgi:hypothetical protein